MAQDFSTRYLLVDGQGNFGSIDDDPPAAMRYTEARLTKAATEMLTDLEANTVDFQPNFDGTLQEPKVLPALLPNLLLNGVTGIAVGMATSIPPHNLQEVLDALIYLIDHRKEATVYDLMQFVKGPDFPTGGIILGDYGIRQAYTSGRGSVTIRSVIDCEENKKGRLSLIVSEIPYQVSKRRLLEQIAQLVHERKLEGISDLRDESDKDGMRVVIELKRDAIPKVVMNNLYKHTLLQSNFGITMLALVNGRPEILDLREIMEYYLRHREEVIRRRTQFFLDKALARDHIVQGLIIVQDRIDEVIKDIRSSESTAEAHEILMQKYQLSQQQASAVLDMQLRRLTALEKKKLEDEHLELLAKINDFRDILSNPERVNLIMKEEFNRVSDKHKDKRRTQLLPDPGSFTNEDLIPDEQMAIFVTNQGYIKRIPVTEFENQQRGGRGRSGLTTREDDFVSNFFVSSSHSSVLFFTNRGVAFQLKVYEIPETSRQAKGSSIANLISLQKDERITAVIPVSEFKEDHYLVMLTRNGIIKKTDLYSFRNVRSNGLIAIGLEEDELGWVGLSDGKSHIVVGTSRGYSIRYSEKDIRPSGRTSRGVKAITLREGDKVVSLSLFSGDFAETEEISELEDNEEIVIEAEETEMVSEEVVNENSSLPQLLTVTTDGYGKRTPVEMYRVQRRGGMGIINIKLRDTSKVASMLSVNPDDEIVIVTSNGIVIRQKVSEISSMSRSTKGVRLQKLDNDDKVMAVQLITDPDEKSEEVQDNPATDNPVS